MTDFSQQQPIDQPPYVMAQKQLDSATDSLFNRIFRNNQTLTDQQQISTGQIQAMAVPAGWERRADSQLPAGAGLTEFHAPGQDNVRLNSFYRGSRVGAEAARAFHECLAKPPHQLHANEIKALSQVLGDKDDGFDIFFARTVDLNGKRVLSVEGSFKDKDHTSEKTIYVDTDGTGSAVQEISYAACGKDYQRYLGEAEKAFRSIVWK